MTNKATAVLVVSFFVGFPTLGLYFCWADAHGKIRSSAGPFAEEAAHKILEQETVTVLDEFGTLAMRKGKSEQNYLDARKGLGKLLAIRSLKPTGSWADNPDDTIFQYVRFSGEAEFEKGTKLLKLVAARRTMNPEWRVDSLELLPR